MLSLQCTPTSGGIIHDMQWCNMCHGVDGHYLFLRLLCVLPMHVSLLVRTSFHCSVRWLGSCKIDRGTAVSTSVLKCFVQDADLCPDLSHLF